MGSVIDPALGINEIVTAILSHLTKKDLKSARIVRRTWASLGGQQLIGDLYISPREIDMVAFDGITQHPDLSKSVKRLVYDSAQFFKFDVGSPSARAYVTSGLQPLTPKPLDTTPDTMRLIENGLSDGHSELPKLAALVHAADLKPLCLDAINDVETISGLPASTFEAMRSGHAGPLAALTENLKVLRLEIVAYARDPVTENEMINLADFFHKASRLEVTSLGLPFQYITQTPRYRLDQILKPILQGIRPTLRKLHIRSISASYNDLSRLLFFSLPNLKHLNLTQVLLLNGKWEDVVEGLRQIVPLTSGDLERCSQSDQTPYSLDSNSTAEEAEGFAAANSRYIVEGGTHPCAPAYVPSYELKESIKSSKKLRGEFEGAQNIEGDAPNHWSTDLPLRNV
ncbi:MAG: hypothetical protein Q9205_005774 [Flavoplaca limonia]